MAAIQVLSKTDYTAQRIVPAPPPETLPADAVRIQSRLISLTTNNFTYAKVGGLNIPGLAWWDVWPTPAQVSSTHCRISAWGFSEVTESTIPSIPVGTHLLGYQPIGTASEILHLSPASVTGHWVENSPRRKGLVGIYNRYCAVPWTAGDAARTSRGWDALMYFLFGSSHSLNRFVFSEVDEQVTHPLGHGEWPAEKAKLDGALVVLLAASGKTGISFAHLLRQRAGKPSKVVAVGSAVSREFSLGTGLFDEVWGYEDLDGPLPGVEDAKKVVLVNFGARGDFAERWARVLRAKSKTFQVLLVGRDPEGDAVGGELGPLAYDPTSDVEQMNAGGIREAVIAKLGEEEYFRDLGAAWEKFKADGAVQGLKMVWLKGIEGVEKGWAGLVKQEYGPDTGVLVEL